MEEKDLDFLFEEDKVAYNNAINSILNGDKEQAKEFMDKLVKRMLTFQDATVNKYDEYETDTHLCTREAYFSECGEIRYGYTVFAWTGEYITNDSKLARFRTKKWQEILHYTSSERKSMNKFYLAETLDLIKRLHNEVND